MGNGVSYGGGHSSRGHLFGGGEAPRPAPLAFAADKLKEIPAGIQCTQPNYYFRAQGQNCGIFLTDRPSTEVHASLGGFSSLGYLFGCK